MRTTTTPQFEQIRYARTTTPNRQMVRVMVTSVESESAAGWHVWGYRLNHRLRTAQSQIPRLYFIAKDGER